MQQSRIVALALIGIMLSSSSVSVADGYTVWLEISEIKASQASMVSEKLQIYKIKLHDATEFSMSKNTVDIPESHVINLIDGVTGSFVNKVYDKGLPFQIKLFDGSAVSTLNDVNEQSFNIKNKKIVAGLHTFALRTDDKTISLDFRTYLTSIRFVKKQIIAYVTGTSVYGLSKNNLKQIKICLPKIKEQENIASILSNVDNLINKYNSQIATTKIQKKGLMQQLLTKGIAHKKFKKINLGVRSQEILIPESWSFVKLHELSEHITKGATPTTYGYEWSKNPNDTLFIRNECIKENQFRLEGSLRININAHEFMTRSKIKSGDPLISITGNIGITCLFPNDYPEANINQHIARIRINSKKLIPKYLLNVLNSNKYYTYFHTINQGLTHPHLSLGQVQNTVIPLPSNEEQQTIVSILSNVDNKTHDLELKKAKFEILKKGLMQKLLTGQIRVKV